MSKVITFSRYFPSYHPKKGQPTYFVEKIWKGLGQLEYEWDLVKVLQVENLITVKMPYSDFIPKYHTIRAGHRWKVGDKFSPRVWSGKPYNSNQIIIAPDIEIKKVWDITVNCCLNEKKEKLLQVHINGKVFDTKEQYASIAANDGLSETELLDWFWNPKKTFEGQVICWNESINY
jgi:hypothetical protein